MDAGRRILVSLAVVLTAGAASAAPVPVQNAGFEAPVQSGIGEFTSLTPPGWSIHDPDGLFDDEDNEVLFGIWWPTPFTDYGAVAEGNQVGYAFSILKPGTGEVGLRQTLPAVLSAGTRVSFDVGVGDPTGASDSDLTGFPGYRVELWAGDALVASDDDTPGVEGQFRFARATTPIGALHPGLGEPLELRLLNRNADTGAEVDFDAVGVDVSAAPLESYRFRVADAEGSLEGWFVYDRSRSAQTQELDSDAALTITSATGDLAAFAGVDTAEGLLNAAGTVLTVTALTGQHFVLFFFGQSLSLAEPLPLGAFQPASTDVFVGGVQRFDGADPGAAVELPEPVGGGAAAVFALALLGGVRRARSAPASRRGACSGTGRTRSARRGADRRGP